MISLVQQIQLASHVRTPELRVTDEGYQRWRDQLTVDLICGLTVGGSFVEYFGVHDSFLAYCNPPLRDVERHVDRYYR